MSNTPARRRSASEWQRIMDEFDRRGQTQREFCEQKDLVLSTFQFWVRKLRSSKPSPAFIPITPVETSVSGWSIEIELPDGTITRLHNGAS